MNTKYTFGGFKPPLFFVLVVILFSTGMGTAAAANPIVSISASETTVCVGADFQLYISVDPNGNTLEQVMTDLGYDSSKVSLTVTNGGMFQYMFDEGTPGTNSIDGIMGLSNGVSTPGNLAVLTMHASNPGTFTLALSQVSAGTASGSLTPDVNQGTVTINVCDGDDNGDDDTQGVPVVEIFPADKTVCVGDDFQVFISVDPDGNTLEQVMADLGYDSSKVSLTVTDGSMFEYMFDEGTPDTNSIDEIMGLSNGVSTPGNLAVLTMHASNPGTFTLALSQVSVGTAGGSLTPVVNSGTVTINECLGPQPEITEPDEGDVLSGTVTITEVDVSGRTIVYNLFQYSEDGSTWTDIFNDTDGSDGWSADWDTMGVADGDYFIGVTMGDNEGLTGSAQIQVTVGNPPEPSITRPSDGAQIRRGTTIIIEEVDDSGQGDVDSNKFEYSPAGTNSWTVIGTDNDGSDGWSVSWNIPESMEPGEYDILATMTDSSGNKGTDMITILIVTEGIPLYQGWNLFSVPTTLDNSTVDYVLEGIPAGSILMYYNPIGLFDNIDNIEPLQGYMLYVPSEFTIVNLEPKSVPPAMNGLDMYVGWNIIGLTGFNTGSAEDALVLGGIDDSYEEIQNWDATANPPQSTQYGYNCNVYPSPCPPAFQGVSTEDFNMYTYEAYWVEMVADDVYTGQ